VGRTVVLDHTAGLSGTGTISGLAPAALVQYINNDVRSVVLTGSNFADAFFARSTPESGIAIPVTINGSGGSDFVAVGSAANTLDTIRGPVTVNGGSGTDFLQINDQGSTTGHLYGITASSVTRQFGNSVTINYSSIESLQVNKSTAPIVFNPDPFFPQVADLAFTDSIRAGEFATLSGRLVDGDAGDVLSLIVDWGDGSQPEESTPDREPFALTHTYDAPGTYTVRVIWTDSAGESNFRDLTLKVKHAKKGGHGGQAAFD
jgi:hypothetical protein